MKPSASVKVGRRTKSVNANSSDDSGTLPNGSAEFRRSGINAERNRNDRGKLPSGSAKGSGRKRDLGGLGTCSIHSNGSLNTARDY
jgi:hypothetical protein